MSDYKILKRLRHKPISDQIGYVRIGMQIAYGLTTVGKWTEAQEMFSEMNEILYQLSDELEDKR
jgi:hypothetical protein|tara:strand:- start:289 stop:480 length:192 start_codon:yes stop_codon:yes gene_type:complete